MSVHRIGRVYLRLTVLAVASLFSNRAAQAIMITTGDGNGADAHVQLGTPDTNYNGTEIPVKYAGNNTSTVTRKGYLRFDTSSLTDTVTAASLSLVVTINNGGGTNTTGQNFTFNIYGLNDGSAAGGGKLGEDWGETDITWDNAPANIVSGAGAGNAVLTGAGTANGGQAQLLGNFSVTSSNGAGSTIIALNNAALVNFLNADTNDMANFIITRTGWTSGGGSPAPNQGGANSVFASDEHASLAPPTLDVTVVPEPSTFILAGCGALGLFCFARRRR